MANFVSPNQIQIQIGLFLFLRPDTCDDTLQPCRQERRFGPHDSAPRLDVADRHQPRQSVPRGSTRHFTLCAKEKNLLLLCKPRPNFGLISALNIHRIAFRTSVMIALLFVSLTVPNFGGSVITVLAYVLSPSFYLLLTSKCKDTDKNLCRALSRCYC